MSETREEKEKKLKPRFSMIRDRITPGLLILIFTSAVAIWVRLETVTFSSVEMKVDTERVIKSIINKPLLDSITSHIRNEEIHKPYEVMNELWMPRKEIDSLNLENTKYMNQLSTQIDATNRMVYRTNQMVQEFINSQKK